MNRRSVAALILAAGESSRMGRDKALLSYRGEPFLQVVLGNVRAAGLERIAVVLGHHAAEIQQAVPLSGADVIVNLDYRLGQTSSLTAGLKALDLAAMDGILLCLVDHPGVSAATIRRLCKAHHQSGAPVTIPTHQGRSGHPVLLGRVLFKELLELNPSQGANTVVRKYLHSACRLDVDDAGVTMDIDQPEDYRRLVEEADPM